MKYINLKAVIYGYLVFFIPSFILSFIGFEIGSGAFIFMIVGGYITARFAPEFEVINVISLAFFSYIFSLLTVGIIKNRSAKLQYPINNTLSSDTKNRCASKLNVIPDSSMK